MIRNILLALIIVGGWLYANHRDDQAARARQPQTWVRSPESYCPERDYIGRHLVATYYARSDMIQTKRCTYTRSIFG